MGIGFVILAYVTFYAILAAALSLATWLIGYIFPSRKRLLRRLLFCALAVMAAVPASGFVAVTAWRNFTPPTFQYRSVFGSFPGVAVEDLRGRAAGLNDYGEIFLSFRDTPGALAVALGSAEFRPADPAETSNLVPMQEADAPVWWAAATCRDRSAYLAEKARKWDEIVVTRCRSDQTIYVQARWIE
jgi:hypothetical protein